MTRSKPNPVDPRGAGVVVREVRMDRKQIVRFGALLAGYDHLVSLHGDEGETLLLVTTESRIAELDEVLEELRKVVPFETLTQGETFEP